MASLFLLPFGQGVRRPLVAAVAVERHRAVERPELGGVLATEVKDRQTCYLTPLILYIKTSKISLKIIQEQDGDVVTSMPGNERTRT